VALFWEVLLLVGPEDSKQPVRERTTGKQRADLCRRIGGTPVYKGNDSFSRNPGSLPRSRSGRRGSQGRSPQAEEVEREMNRGGHRLRFPHCDPSNGRAEFVVLQFRIKTQTMPKKSKAQHPQRRQWRTSRSSRRKPNPAEGREGVRRGGCPKVHEFPEGIGNA